MKPRVCRWNVQCGDTWRRCSTSAMAVLHQKAITVFDHGMTARTITMSWYQCSACAAWLPAWGIANDALTAVSIEMRAAEIADFVMQGRRDGSNGGELAGWLTYAADSAAGALEVDEAAGYLAAAIWRHDAEQAGFTPISDRQLLESA